MSLSGNGIPLTGFNSVAGMQSSYTFLSQVDALSKLGAFNTEFCTSLLNNDNINS